jgi:acyl-CoA thioesterase FadM
MHFSAFFPMMEAAEHELLRALGLSVMPKSVSGGSLSDQSSSGDFGVTWPRVSASCQYLAAAKFEDLLTIAVQVVRIGTTSVEYSFHFSRDGQQIAEGKMTSVCCRLIRGDHVGEVDRGDCSEDTDVSGSEVRLEKTPVPDEIRELLTRYR